MVVEMMKRAIAQPKAQRFIILGLSATVLSVGAALSWLGATKAPEMNVEQAITQDGEWLHTTTADLGYSREQFNLFMLNRDPSRGQQGLLWSAIDAESQRFIAQAYRNIQNPKDKQFGNSVVECLEAFGVNIQKEHRKAILPSDKAKAIIRLIALETAIDSIVLQVPLRPGESQDALMQVILEKRKIDRGAARMVTPDGMASQYLKDKAEAERVHKEEEKARKDFDNGK